MELAKSGEITCSASGNGLLIFGDSSGSVWVVDRRHAVSFVLFYFRFFNSHDLFCLQIAQIKAYGIGVTHCAAINKTFTQQVTPTAPSSSKFFIVTIGSDTEDFAPILKVWHVNENIVPSVRAGGDDRASNVVPSSSSDTSSNIIGTSPHASDTIGPQGVLIRSIRLSSNSSSSLAQLSSHATVTAVSLLDDKFMAIGFNDGNCLIIKGDLTRDKNLKMQMLDVRSNGSSISGLSFASYTKTSSQQEQHQANRAFRAFNAPNTYVKQHVFLFVCTRNEISSFDLSNKNKETKFVLGLFVDLSVLQLLTFLFFRLIWLRYWL